MYPNSFIDELKVAIPISTLIGRKYPLKQKGRDFWCCCPFHNENTPSFCVSDTKGIYKCFGCGEGGNIFDFVMKTEHLNFKETIEYLANNFGITLPKIEKKQNKDEINDIDLLFKINTIACSFFEEQMDKNKVAIEYANKRGLTPQYIKKFKIGFAPNSDNMLIEFAKKHGIFEKDLLNAGVVVNKNGLIRDKFKNRLMFPVLNRSGKVVAFQGRTLLTDGIPKYLNSPETKIFIKGNTLFNYYFAKDSIRREKGVVLVEGNMDALSLSIKGIENVVAPMGTGVTENQIKELWKNTNNIFVCFDGDNAGQKAMQRLSKLVLPLIKTSQNMNFIFLPKEFDPDDFVKKEGKNAFDDLLKNAIPLSEYIWSNEINGLNLQIPENRASLEQNINIILDTINDNNLKRSFKQIYKNKLFEISRKYNKFKNEIPIKTQEIKNKIVIDTIEKKEKEICERIIKFPSITEKLNEIYNIDVTSINFNTEKCNECIELLSNSSSLPNHLLKYFQPNDIWEEEKSLVIIYILYLERYLELLTNELKNTINGAKIKTMADEIKKTRENINKLKLENEIV